MFPGVVLILVGGAVLALALGNYATDFHLFAGLNVIGLGALCCTVSWNLGSIHKELIRQRSERPQPAATPSPEPPAEDPLHRTLRLRAQTEAASTPGKRFPD